MHMSFTAPQTPSVSPDQAQAALNAAVASYAARGWTVSSVTGTQAILQRKQKIGWFWNILLSLITGGIWLIVVIVRLVNRKIETVTLTVDQSGRINKH